MNSTTFIKTNWYIYITRLRIPNQPSQNLGGLGNRGSKTCEHCIQVQTSNQITHKKKGSRPKPKELRIRIHDEKNMKLGHYFHGLGSTFNLQTSYWFLLTFQLWIAIPKRKSWEVNNSSWTFEWLVPHA